MASPAALAAQLGWKSESTYGTAVVVDKFHAGFLSESIQQQIARIESQGKRAGRRTNHAWVPGAKTVGGQVSLELWDEPASTLLRHMFGTIATSGAGPYTHTASPGDLSSQSLTFEVGRPDGGGTVRSFVYAGCKIPTWTLSSDVGSIPTLQLDVSAQSEATGGSLASASYPTAAPFVFTQASIDIAGTEVTTVNSASLTANSNLATARHRLNSANINEQLEDGTRVYNGTIDAEFEDLTAYNRFVSGTEAALVFAFDNGTDSLTITMNVRFDGETPTVPDSGRLMQPLPYACTSGTSDSAAIEAILVNGEATAT